MFRQVLPTSVAAFLVLFSLAACTKPNAPTKENFTKAILADMKQRPLDFTLAFLTPHSFLGDTQFNHSANQLNRKVLVEKNIYVPTGQVLQYLYGVQIYRAKFSLNEKNPLLKGRMWCDAKMLGFRPCHLIYGRYVFDKILSSTAPATTSDGRIVSHVNVRFKLAFNPLEKALQPLLPPNTGTSVVGKLLFIQETNGWRVDEKSLQSLSLSQS